MAIYEKVHDTMSRTKLHNIVKNVKSSTVDHNKTKVILGQGQIRPAVQVSSDTRVKNLKSAVTDYELIHENPNKGRDEVLPSSS